MIYYECKCGANQFYGSGMMPEPCSGCDKCGTVPGPRDKQQPPIPHDFQATKVETDDGDATLSRCRWCHHTKKQIERMAKKG